MAKFLLYLKSEVIYCRITQDGTITELSTEQRCPADKWDAAKKRMKGSTQLAKSVNDRLDSILANLRNAETALKDIGKPYAAKDIKEIYQGKTKRTYSVQEVLTEYVEYKTTDPNARLSDSTIRNYKGRESNLLRYLKEELKKPDYPIAELDAVWMEYLQAYLSKKRKLGQANVGKHLDMIKSVVRYAKRRKYIGHDYVSEVEVPRQTYSRADIIYLDEQQLKSVEEYPFTGTLERVMDACIVQAHTGMAYREVFNFKRDWLYKGIDGQWWIEFYRQKNYKHKSYPIKMPVDEVVLSKIEKYRNHPECQLSGKALWVPSLTAVNNGLKLIAGLLNLPPNLSSHHFRKTAGMIWLNNNVPLETVAELLGDTVAVVRQHYARVIEEKIARDMAAFSERMRSKQVQ